MQDSSQKRKIKAKVETQFVFPVVISVIRHKNAEELNDALCKEIYALEERWSATQKNIANRPYVTTRGPNNFQTPSQPPIIGSSETFKRLYADILKPAIDQHVQTICQSALAEFNIAKLDWYIPYAWAIILRKNSFQGPHIHKGMSFSGVYYAKVPDDLPFPEGYLQLLNPHMVSAVHPSVLYPGTQYNTHLDSIDKFIKPENGMVVIFPSWLQHLVPAFYGEGDRICIPFDVLTHSDPRKIKE